MTFHLTALALLTVMPLSAAAAAPGSDTTRVCLAPASVQMASGNTADGANAVRESLTSYLTGRVAANAAASAAVTR